MIRVLAFLLLSLFSGQLLKAAVTFDGEPRKWHRISLSFDGPSVCEDDNPSPFLDYRMTVTFTNGSTTYVVPGFFAADGDAAETSATCGDQWRVNFTPDRTGTWNYSVEFVTGTDIAISTGAGTPTSFDGASGSFPIYFTDKSGRDFRGKGTLVYDGYRYLRFKQTREFYIQAGPGSPENLLAYSDFDGTYNNGGTDYVRDWTPHKPDWNPGDPVWQGTKGKGLIGAMNYISSEGLNSQYLLTFNVGGDGKDVWPYTSPSDRFNFDVSKLAQWEILFNHMDSVGIVKHILFQEQENDQFLDGGDLGRERKVYMRELIARFGHNLGLIWNLGEENTNTHAQRVAHANYLSDLDAYDHKVHVHTYPSDMDDVYNPLLGNANFDGASLQIASTGSVDDNTLEWVTNSELAGRPWVVVMSENGPAGDGLKPDVNDPSHDQVRKWFMWNHFINGGAGVEWYFGYGYADNDLNCDDFTTRSEMWRQVRVAQDFMDRIPYHIMKPRHDLVSRYETYCLAHLNPGHLYVVQLPNGDWTDLTIETPGEYKFGWYDPVNGGNLIGGTSFTVASAGDTYRIENPPTSDDWVAVVVRRDAPPLKIAELFAEEQSEIRVYPSMVQNDVVVETSAEGEYELVLFDLSGRQVFRSTSFGQGNNSIPLVGILPGGYVYHVTERGIRLQTGKLMKR